MRNHALNARNAAIRLYRNRGIHAVKKETRRLWNKKPLTDYEYKKLSELTKILEGIRFGTKDVLSNCISPDPGLVDQE